MNDWPFAFFPEDLSTWNACVSEYSDIKAERDRLKAAFDDRVRVIELQLEDKRQMQELIDQYREALEFYANPENYHNDDWGIKAVCYPDKEHKYAWDLAKQALEVSDGNN